MAERLSGASARLARRARTLVGYWRSERRTLRQGTVALGLSTCAGFVAGLVLGSITGTLQELPGLLVLIPASVGMRGTIFGAMGARLGTGVAIGMFEPTLQRGKPPLPERDRGDPLVAALVLLPGGARDARRVRVRAGPVISFWALVTISVLGGILASGIALLVTVGIAVLSFRKGWDLDAVSTPMVTAIGDMVTLPCLFLASLLVHEPAVNAVVAALCTVATASRSGPRSEWTRRSGGSSWRCSPWWPLTPLLDIAAGALLQAHSDELQLVPAVLILIPPFVSQAGALGGDPLPPDSLQAAARRDHARGRPEIPAIVDGAIVIVLGVGGVRRIGAVSWALSALLEARSGRRASLIGASLLSGALVLPITLVVGYYVAVLTASSASIPTTKGSRSSRRSWTSRAWRRSCSS